MINLIVRLVQPSHDSICTRETVSGVGIVPLGGSELTLGSLEVLETNESYWNDPPYPQRSCR